MRSIPALIALLCIALAASGVQWAAAAQNPLAKAEQLLAAGNAARALELIEAAPQARDARGLEFKGRCLLALERLDQAQAAFQQAVTKAETHGDRLTLGRAHVGLGALALRRGEVDAADRSLKRGVGVLERTGHKLAAVPAYVRLAETALARNDPQSALSYLFMAESILATHPSNPARLDIYTGVVAIYERQEQLKQAIPYMESAYREVAARNKTAQMRAWCYRISRAYEKTADLEKALAWQQKELELAQTLGRTADIPGILVDLGVLSFKHKKSVQGRAYFEQALELLHSAGDEVKQADVLWQLSEVYALLEDYGQAAAAMRRCLEIEQRINAPELAQDRERLKRFERLNNPEKERDDE
ncbi:MAG: hypothetical protein P9M14_00620 [Candidatus Alcyoniella australis]|nr:hypothetical protein [Candidatus Alcyoniella australis]